VQRAHFPEILPAIAAATAVAAAAATTIAAADAASAAAASEEVPKILKSQRYSFSVVNLVTSTLLRISACHRHCRLGRHRCCHLLFLA